MTNENQHTTVSERKPVPPVPFGTRLKSAREALGLDCKDAAAQLRLNEKIILMLEKEHYPSDLPATFIRGYIRAYAKLLQIPEHEIKKAIEPIKQVQVTYEGPMIKPVMSVQSVENDTSFMQFFSYIILFILLGLAGTWWYNHSTTANSVSDVNPTAIQPQTTITPTVTPATPESTPATAAPSKMSGPPPASIRDSTTATTAPNTQENAVDQTTETSTFVKTPGRKAAANTDQDDMSTGDASTNDLTDTNNEPSSDNAE